MFRQAPVSVSVIDRDYRIVDGNESLRRTFGPWQDRYCYELFKRRDAPCETCRARETFVDGEVRLSQETGVDCNGRPISYMLRLAPLVEENGHIPYIIEMATDVTEFSFLQRRFEKQQERYRLLFEEVPCYITIQDREFNLLETNRLFREHFGDTAGCRCYEVYKHRNEQCYPCPVAETFSDGQVRRSEEVVTSKKGDQINVVCYTAPIRNKLGEITAVMEMSTDITQIRELQSQLTSIGLLVSSISHGVKSLLMGLDGGIYAVDSGFDKNDPDRIRRGWDMVKRNVTRIRSLVLNILYYAKDRDLEWEPLHAADVAVEVADIIRERARVAGVDFSCDTDPAAGDFEADAKALRSVLMNVLENAVDACRVDKEQQHKAITLRARGDAHNVFFEVADNGIGMDRETMNKIFTLFFSSKGVGGTGLGLFVSNKIMQQHGGDISVVSKPGQGTTFTMRFPRQKTECNLEPAGAPENVFMS